MSWKSSKSESPSALPETVTVGRVRKPHGVRGEVVVDVLSDVADRFAAGSEVSMRLANGNRQRARILAATFDRSNGRLRIEGVESRDQAEGLRGAVLEVERAMVPPAPQGSYYYFELVGCTCADGKHGELGRVERVLEDGGGLLLEIRDQSNVLLIPFVEEYLERVSVAGRRIEVLLPEGLIETCTSMS